MKPEIQEKANAFHSINEIALKGEIVIFGSTYMANFPFYELANKCHLEHAIYNRSIDGMTTADAEELLQSCVLEIEPQKVFLQLGESDQAPEDALQHYETILRMIRKTLPSTKVYLIGLPEETEAAKRFNRGLRDLCDNKHVFSIFFAVGLLNKMARYTAQFKQLTRFFRDNPISLTEAFAMAEL